MDKTENRELKKLVTVGIGDIKVSSSEGERIKTYALGSCVAVIGYDFVNKIAGMIHVALPDSRINKDKARISPAHFADTGVPLLLSKMSHMGADKRSSWIKIVGGASIIKQCEHFEIGKRNVSAIKKILSDTGYFIEKEDIGGNKSRTVSIDVSSGKILISTPEEMKEKIGQYFMRMNLLSLEETKTILIIQQSRSNRKFGEIALDMGYLVTENLDLYLQSKSYLER